ncbi:hypothetical protein HK100_001902, partial [Physocladia obscura]
MESDSPVYGDISMQLASATFFFIDEAFSLDDGNVRNLVDRIKSVSTRFKIINILFYLTQKQQQMRPQAGDGNNFQQYLKEQEGEKEALILPFANSLPMLAFERALYGTMREIQKEIMPQGVLLPKVDLVPVTRVEDVLRIIDGVCTEALDTSEDDMATILEDAGQFSGGYLLEETASVAALSLLSGAPAPLNLS